MNAGLAAALDRLRSKLAWRHLASRWLPICLVAGVVALVLPVLITPVLPFHDSPGIVGLGGALALRDDPTARVRELYAIDIRAYPSALYFGWAALAGALGVSVEWAFSLFLALFCLAGPPLALWLLLDAFQRPRHLALLAIPVGYHHQIWYGFLGSSAAITGMLAALAFARRLHDRRSVGNHLGLAASVLFVAAAHPFPLALTGAALLPLLCWPPRGAERDRRALLLAFAGRLAALLPAAVFLAGWVASFFAGRTGNVSLGRRLSVELPLRAPSLADAPRFLDWLGNGYAASWDALVPGLALLTVIALLVWGVRPSSGDDGNDRSNDVRWLTIVGLGWPALLLGCGYLFLPMQIMWPEPWWGLRVRCVVPFFLVCVALVRPRPRGLPVWTVAPAFAAGLAFALYVAVDFATYWRAQVLDGFDEAVAAIPPGQSLLFFPAAATSERPERHYSLPHPYLGQHYVARRGGRALPHLRGHPGAYWITMKPPEPPAPGWGDPAAFRWDEHAAGFDYFLQERPMPGGGPLLEPMRTAPNGAVGEVLVKGRFILWNKLTAAPATSPAPRDPAPPDPAAHP